MFRCANSPYIQKKLHPHSLPSDRYTRESVVRVSDQDLGVLRFEFSTLCHGSLLSGLGLVSLTHGLTHITG